MGVPLKRSRQNSNFLTTYVWQMKFSKEVIICERWNMAKLWGYHNGVPLKQGRQNLNFLIV